MNAFREKGVRKNLSDRDRAFATTANLAPPATTTAKDERRRSTGAFCTSSGMPSE